MDNIAKQIANIQKEIRETPYHKGTEHYIGLLRARIAKLKDKQLDQEVKAKSGGGGGYALKKQGDATVVLVGPPSVGKSTLLNKLTNANSKIAPYAFTTVSVIPGIMTYKDARIQILDVPGLIEGAEEGKGRGREVLSVIRGANLLLIMTEPQKLEALDRISQALERNGIRINKEKPKILVDKKLSGGITVRSNLKQTPGKETIKEIVQEMGLKNAEVTIKEKINLDLLLDALSRNRVYIPALYVVNKCDTAVYKLVSQTHLSISATENIGLSNLKEEIYQKLCFIRVYLVKKDEAPSQNSPLVVREGELLSQIAEKIGEKFSEKIDHAVIWGTKAKFPGQEVSLQTKTQEGMMIRFV